MPDTIPQSVAPTPANKFEVGDTRTGAKGTLTIQGAVPPSGSRRIDREAPNGLWFSLNHAALLIG
jgi:hypothetical protein